MVRGFPFFLNLWAAIYLANSAYATDCKQWFEKSKIKPGPHCVAECSAQPVGMATFNCSLDCKKFCSSSTSFSEHAISSVLKLYPSLTKAERDFASQNPKQALVGYKLSYEAEDVCSQQYSVSATNDESDACRHFIWAGLMRNELDLRAVETILEAHEAEDLQSPEEKAMDLANNRAGLISAEVLIRDKSFTKAHLFKEFQKKISSGGLIVIKKNILEGKKNEK